MKPVRSGRCARLCCAFAALAVLAPALPPAGLAAEGVEDAPSVQSLARVGDQEITSQDLTVYMQAFYITPQMREELERRPVAERQEFQASVRRQALQDLIERRLFVQQARRQYLAGERSADLMRALVDHEQVRLTDRLGSSLRVHQWLRRQGLSLEQWRGVMADQILYEHYVREEVNARAHVAPADLRRYYDEHVEELRRPGRVRYRMILIDPAACADEQEERARAEQVLARVRGSEGFAAVADQVSLDRGRYPGGLREVEAPLDSPGWLPAVCAGLAPGQVSDVRKSAAGFCIVKLEEVVPGRQASFEEAQPALRERLEGEARRARREILLADLRRRAGVEILDAGRRILRTAPAAP
jgi:parvulin-like peptidyl-prolyl isomerase